MEINLNDFAAWLQGKMDSITSEAERIMKDEVPKKTGSLEKSIYTDPISSSEAFVGTDLDYAYYVEHGRGEVVPRWTHTGVRTHPYTLHWVDGGDVFAMRSGPTKPNDFVGRTVRRLKQYIATL